MLYLLCSLLYDGRETYHAEFRQPYKMQNNIVDHDVYGDEHLGHLEHLEHFSL